MPSIEKRTRVGGKTSYRARVKYKGRSLTSTHIERAKAERWAAEHGARIRDDVHFSGESSRKRLMTDLIDRYVEHELPHKCAPRNQRTQLTWWRQHLGHLQVGSVTRSVVAAGRDALLKPHSGSAPRGPATVVRYLAVLSHLFTVAINDWEWAETNPVRGVRKPKEPRGRDRYLLADERVRLIEACRGSASADLYPFVMLALSTGMRRGEIESLEWQDVDFVRGAITLRDSKNGTARGIPLRGPVVEILQGRGNARTSRRDLVFPGKNPKRPVDLTTPWHTALRRAGIEGFRMHDLRHTAASYLAMNGASSLELAAILGHKTLQMTKRYTHLSVDHLGSVIQRMNEGIPNHV